MKEIYFVRHGETEWNVLGKLQGAEADIPLNENGKLQSGKTGKYLRKYRLKNINNNLKQFDCVFTSPLSRAKETCEIICEEIDYVGKIKFCEELIEYKRGKFSGVNIDNKIYQEYLKKYNNESFVDPIDRLTWYEKDESDSSNMESFKESEKRSKKFIKKLKNSKCSKILVVSHGGFLYGHLLPIMFGIPSNIFQNKSSIFNGSNCSICYVQYNEKKDIFKMITVPNILHLNITDF
jgi:probable phosphoglycerate mutase